VRYYLDENQPVAVARAARRLGLDVISTEEVGRKGANDDSQLEFAASQGRVLITRDSRDFVRLTRRFMTEGSPHAGVLIVSSSLALDDFAGIAAAMLRYDREHPAGMPPYAIDYLVRVVRGVR
jgi:predicted nuclease of predicted toxin-antitoxin system